MSVTGTAPARTGYVTEDSASYGWASSYAQAQGTAFVRWLGLQVRGGWWVQASYVILDISFACLNSVLSFYLSFAKEPGRKVSGFEWRRLPSDLPFSHYGALVLLYAGLLVLVCQSQHLYRTMRGGSAVRESLRLVWAVTVATLILAAFIYLLGAKDLSRFVVLVSGLLNIFTLSLWRLGRRWLVVRRVAEGIGARNALIVGAGRVGQELASYLERNLLLGYKVKGFLDGDHVGDPRILGRVEDFDRVVRAQFVDEVFITIPSQRELVKMVVTEAQRRQLNVNIIPELYDGFGWNVPLRHLGGFPVMDLHWQPIPSFGLIVKRVIDVIFSGFALVVLLPFLAVLAVWIKLDSPGPGLYRSRRVGKKGRVFHCYKLRTMGVGADELKESLRWQNERNGPFFKIKNDPRITRLGKFLRKYSLDELPQLWNVLRGDMSLIGPRPHPIDDYKQYELAHLRRLEVKPGITGLWQVSARQDPSFETSMALDLKYIENWNLRLDMRIFSRTFGEIVKGSGS